MTKFYIHIITLMMLGIVASSCTDSSNMKQENEPVKKTATSEKHKLPQEFFVAKKHPEGFSKNQESKTMQETYTAAKVEQSGTRVEGQLSEIVSKDVAMMNSAKPSLRKNMPATIFSEDRNVWILTLIFDNDIFNNTDYYYTSGARIELVTPFANSSPINKILPGAGKSATNFSGFSLQQNIYTPIDPDANEIQYDDRPFSAFLTIGQFRESVNFESKINLKSEFSFGIVGPASLGEAVQSSIHTIEPVGWHNQVKNDIVLNYAVRFEKGLISNNTFELNATAQANIGTLFDKAGGGFYFRAGSFLPVYRGSLSAITGKKTKQPAQYWFFVRGNVNAVLYDATLEGGLLSNENPYVISQNEMNRLVYGGSAGIAFYYKQVGIELENFYLSPEFKSARNFMYGRIKLIATF